jgi:heat shock protein HtpX
MFKSHGMHSYVLNNNLKSLALLAGFLAVVQLMFAAIWAGAGIAFVTAGPSIEAGKVVGPQTYLGIVLDMTWRYSPAVLVLSLVWAFLAFLYYKSILRGMTGLQPASRGAEPRLFNIVENLSISLGMTAPRIEISESNKLNAFAMGLTPATSSIGVTRGLLLALNDRELEAVIAHELTHIRTLDVRLMTFATIFCGIIFSMGWFLTYRFRELLRNAKAKPTMLIPVVMYFAILSTVAPTGFLW